MVHIITTGGTIEGFDYTEKENAEDILPVHH
jgi:hypothetical protein